MAQTTTFENIRNWMVSTLEDAVPSKDIGVPFRVHRGEVDFLAWAQEKPDACFRRFDIANNWDIEVDGTTEGTTQQWRHTFTFVMAYPVNSRRYGIENQRDLDDYIESDFAKVNREIELRGSYNYVTGHEITRLEGMSVEKLGPVWVLAVTYFVQYDRSI